jgi:hypothetical protein
MAKVKAAYPLTLKGELTEPPSRALWLIKWLFIIPHLIILFFLWIAFAFVTVIAFFAILFTGRYPKPLFEFNVGVMRWSWRVSFYSYGALGTDTYPPFTLASTDYPADLDVQYPERLKHWMPLVKWLFAIPHYACLAPLASWGWYHWENAEHVRNASPFGGLLWVLVLIVAIMLLFTRKYFKEVFPLVMGINRWCLRVLAYVGLMTDEYPPFRLTE